MRKTVKLAAASALAAVGLVGASATGAFADNGDFSDHPINACGNSSSSNKAEDYSDIYTTQLNQVNCQIGKFNVNEQSADESEVESEGGTDLVGEVVEVVAGVGG